MQLSDLCRYVLEHYQIQEDFKWKSFPGFSVLVHPKTGKWIALLMRGWDSELGEEIERCDLKCPCPSGRLKTASWIKAPFRMKGSSWSGIEMNEQTDAAVVYSLFDQAAAGEDSDSSLIVLGDLSNSNDSPYQETPILFSSSSVPHAFRTLPKETRRIAEMQALYEHGNGSFRTKCENFLRQGRFMEDYEDEVHELPAFHRYFPTYHDLNRRQLRSYFSWRTKLRNQVYQPATTSAAYLYIYELLSMIGCSSPEDALEKLEAFEAGYADEFEGRQMKEYLQRWKYEFARLHQLPASIIRRYQNAQQAALDEALSILAKPDQYSDEAVFEQLCAYSPKRFFQSVLFEKQSAAAPAAFARIWKEGLKSFEKDGMNLFNYCFGSPVRTRIEPLGNAVCLLPFEKAGQSIVCSPCRRWFAENGQWWEECIPAPKATVFRFRALMHEAERQLRLYWKAGSPLKAKPEEAWAAPLVSQVIEEIRQEEREAARIKVEIRFDRLDTIRSNAALTQQSLLTPEELSETGMQMAPLPDERITEPEEPVLHVQESEPVTPETGLKPEKTTLPVLSPVHEEVPHPVFPEAAPASESFSDAAVKPVLSGLQRQILENALAGTSSAALLRANMAMPEIEADAINEALYDWIGDTAVECTGDSIILIEDYRSDLEEILKGGSFG